MTRQIPGEGADRDDQMTNVVLENILVLAIDQTADENQTEPEIGTTATLQTDITGAQKLVLAGQIGSLSLVLRNVENQLVGSTSTITPSDLGGAGFYIPARDGGGSSGSGTTTAAAPSNVVSLPRGPRGPSMSIIRGTEPTTYEVKRKGGF